MYEFVKSIIYLPWKILYNRKSNPMIVNLKLRLIKSVKHRILSDRRKAVISMMSFAWQRLSAQSGAVKGKPRWTQEPHHLGAKHRSSRNYQWKIIIDMTAITALAS